MSKNINVFVIGSKGIPAKYGGFETFVENLTSRKESSNIQYHISCLADNNKEFVYNNARCFNINVPNIGSSRAVLYDLISLQKCINYIRKNNLKNCIIYILACRIGPFLGYYKKKLKKMGVKVFVNPDGHEWKRSKWNYFIKKYWKISEYFMLRYSDLIICDSKSIENYIHKEYHKLFPDTTYISYGADIKKSSLCDQSDKLLHWYRKYKLKPFQYYLVVGRFVPENNYELIIQEFMQSKSKRDLVIITNVEENKFYKKLLERTAFDKDPRIKFVGTVYDTELLKKIREQAFGYLHGHEVGGTNPSLLEALASTRLNLLLDVQFNKEVGKDGAVYFTKERGSLAKLIEVVECYDEEKIMSLEKTAKNRIMNEYSWKKIVKSYEQLFENEFLEG
jgi:rhamnosyltransferase